MEIATNEIDNIIYAVTRVVQDLSPFQYSRLHFRLTLQWHLYSRFLILFIEK